MRAAALSARRFVLIAMLGVGMFAPATQGAVFESREFADLDAQRRYHTLIEELRCLVCQNQNLADSNAELAADLRDQVYRMIQHGDTDDAIKTYMVERYGDFVLYRPPLRVTTVALWMGPFGFLLVAGYLLWSHLRGRAKHDSAGLRDLDADEQRRLETLLAEGADSGEDIPRPSSRPSPKP